MATKVSIWHANPGLGKFNNLESIEQENGLLLMQLSVQKGPGIWVGQLLLPASMEQLQYSFAHGWIEDNVPSQLGITAKVRHVPIVHTRYVVRWDVWHKEDGVAPKIEYTVRDTFSILRRELCLGSTAYCVEKVDLKIHG